MHQILIDAGWEVEEIRNADDEEPDQISTVPDDERKGLTRKLNGCTHYKAVKKNEKYSAQIRIEERYRHTRFYFSAYVIEKNGRHTHDYDLKDICFFKTKEFELGEDEVKKEGESANPAGLEHLDFLASVYAHAQEVMGRIEEKYFR
ncbi:hypothetical protein J4210_05020 [Candidatus Woesearchaeota archaeon]|nr:hypothetical protein [Candidatus Woesearchaeota archaeon]